MKTQGVSFFVGLLFAVLTLTSGAAENPATHPVPKEPYWRQRHADFVQFAQTGRVDLLFLGDSITDNWRTTGAKIWQQHYAPRQAANFGIAGDRTQHLLWRLQNGTLGQLQPKVIVLLIGTNNTGTERNSNQIRNTPAEALAGIQMVVQEIRRLRPNSQLLLLGLFPRNDSLAPAAADLAAINAGLAKLATTSQLHYLDLTDIFRDAAGQIPSSLMPDHLHLSAVGYERWATAMAPTVSTLMK